MRLPCRHVEETVGVRLGGKLASFALTDQALAFEHARDGFLLSMVVNASAGSGVHREQTAPEPARICRGSLTQIMGRFALSAP
jgi:hypothetical protein